MKSPVGIPFFVPTYRRYTPGDIGAVATAYVESFLSSVRDSALPPLERPSVRLPRFSQRSLVSRQRSYSMRNRALPKREDLSSSRRSSLLCRA